MHAWSFCRIVLSRTSFQGWPEILASKYKGTDWYKLQVGVSMIRARDQFVGGAGRTTDEMRAVQGFESAGKDLSDAKRMGAREKHTGKVSRIERGSFIQYMH